MFMPDNDALEKKCMDITEEVCREEKLNLLHWRDVPVDESIPGPMAKRS